MAEMPNLCAASDLCALINKTAWMDKIVVGIFHPYLLFDGKWEMENGK